MLFKKILKINPIFVMIFLSVSCAVPSIRQSTRIGDTDYSGDQGSVGSNDKLFPPSVFSVVNKGTGSEKYLTLEWETVPDAQSYNIYRAVYPGHTYASGSLETKAYKKLITIPADASVSLMKWNHDIPHLPLRRYSYRITAVNNKGESVFSAPAEGWRVPVDAEEALLDIDYNIHFVQSAIPNFGKQNLDITVYDRLKAGSYAYASKVNKIRSTFSNYADFETVLTTRPGFSMAINWKPLGTKMNGSIDAKGLYNATITYYDFIGVEGGYSRSGQISITYQHPKNGSLTRKYSFEEARRLMKTIAYDASEIQSFPPKSEWDESDPAYTEAACIFARNSFKGVF